MFVKMIGGDRHYSPYLLTLCNLVATKEDDGVFFRKRDLMERMKELGHGRGWLEPRLRHLEELGLVRRDGKVFEVMKVRSSFLRLGDDEADELIRTLSEEEFKIYAYLRNSHQISLTRHRAEIDKVWGNMGKQTAFRFSAQKILNWLGISWGSPPRTRVGDELTRLEKMGLIRVGRPPRLPHERGTYMVLEKVERRPHGREEEGYQDNAADNQRPEGKMGEICG